MIFIVKISINDKIFPQKLKIIPKPPKNLYIEGNLKLLNNNTISIVGSRKCSENGINLTKKFSLELSKLGITIASRFSKSELILLHIHILIKKKEVQLQF